MFSAMEPIRQKYLIMSRGFAAAALAVSALQGIFFVLLISRAPISLLGVALAPVTFIVALKYIKADNLRISGIVALLFFIQCLVFIAHLSHAVAPFENRLLQVAIFLMYGGTILAVLLDLTGAIVSGNAMLLSYSIAATLFFGEAWFALDSASSHVPAQHPREPVLTPGAQPHPLLGDHYFPPYTKSRVYYPDNPRGYFEKLDNQTKWKLNVSEHSSARLLFPRKRSMRVEIDKADGNSSQPIMLYQSPLAIERGKQYALKFRARADAVRRITYVVSHEGKSSKNHELYGEVVFNKQWRDFADGFIASTDDANAQLLFHMGASEISAELSDVKLIRLPEGTPVGSTLKEYFVAYRFNAQGCRGRDYAIPRPAGTVRIVALGDSYTWGYGVHESDVYTSQLELLLNDRARAQDSKTVYEVINCGFNGYSAHEERLFYELFASAFEPNIVLVAMGQGKKLGYNLRRSSKLEHLFYSWATIQSWRYQRALSDYTETLEELRKLNDLVGKHDGRMVVVIFRSDDLNNAWGPLLRSVYFGLEETSIPVRDLGMALLEKYSSKDLRVHEVDGHPNQIAHRIAAEEILKLLETRNLLQQAN